MYYNRPAGPFKHFDEAFVHVPNEQMFVNLIRFCGFTSLHPQSWLYKDLLETHVNHMKTGGNDNFRQWCTWPPEYQAFEKIPHRQMTLTVAQFDRWKQWLRQHREQIEQHCRGATWRSQYDPGQQH